MAPMSRLTPLALLCAALLAGCANLAPGHQRPEVPLPAVPAGATAPAALPAWQALVQDERLRRVVDLALANNADLRVALINVERSRAQLRLADADRWPTVNAALVAQRAPNTNREMATTLQAGLQVTSWEVDLAGRLANLSEAAQAGQLASEAGQRSARLALVSQVISAWLTLAADGESLVLAEQSLRDREATEKLALLRFQVGALAEGDWRAVQSLTAAARGAVAQARRQRAQDANALEALVGAPVPSDLLPRAEPGALAGGRWLASVPGGLDSEVLLRRPDVIQAEQQLRAANANIGAARAAFWPRVTLSGNAGQVAGDLADLFKGGNFAWTLASQAAVAIFDSGRNEAGVQVAGLTRDAAVAQYRKAVQSAFREAADALAGQATWGEQLAAQREQLEAESVRHRLARLKYDVGAASQFEWLDAERSLTAARQSLVQVQLAELLNRVALYKALGGDEATAR